MPMLSLMYIITGIMFYNGTLAASTLYIALGLKLIAMG